MKCMEFLSDHSRCRRGVPIARLFRHYFCEGNHVKCPLRKVGKMEERRMQHLTIMRAEA